MEPYYWMKSCSEHCQRDYDSLFLQLVVCVLRFGRLLSFHDSCRQMCLVVRNRTEDLNGQFRGMEIPLR